MTLRTPARTGLVALGGAAGAAARWGVYEVAPVAPGTVPVTTLVINVAGAALLGYLVGRVPVRTARDEAMRLLLGTGVLGGFTTFSTVAVEVWRGPLLLYGLVSVLLGVAAAVVGLALGAAAGPSE